MVRRRSEITGPNSHSLTLALFLFSFFIFNIFLSFCLTGLQKHGGNLSKALEDLHNHIHITIHMPGGGCLRCIFVKSDNLQVELTLEYDEN